MSELSGRIGRLDWEALRESLDERGSAITQRVLTAHACNDLIGLFDDDQRYRSIIDMQRYRFGSGVYKYFDHPLPAPVQQLHEALYPPLARIANDWAERLHGTTSYPATLDEFLEQCHRRGRTRPTPLIFRYHVDDFNALHQDVYGAVGFPFQVLTVLSRPRRRLHRRRVPARHTATAGAMDRRSDQPRAGQASSFPTSSAPCRASAAFTRLNVRHGVSRVRSGTRYTLGVIFHDAE